MSVKDEMSELGLTPKESERYQRPAGDPYDFYMDDEHLPELYGKKDLAPHEKLHGEEPLREEFEVRPNETAYVEFDEGDTHESISEHMSIPLDKVKAWAGTDAIKAGSRLDLPQDWYDHVDEDMYIAPIVVEPKQEVDLVTSTLDYFREAEGLAKHKSAEGGKDTLPYGLKNVQDINLADYTTDGTVDYEAAATALIHKRVDGLRKSYAKWDDMQVGLQRTLLSSVWNQGGSGANSLKRKLNVAMDLPVGQRAASIQKALQEDLLDGFSANDPKDGKLRPITGLLKRKAQEYNMAAEAYNFTPIATFELKRDVKSVGGRTYREAGIYYDADGNTVALHRKQSNRHSGAKSSKGTA